MESKQNQTQEANQNPELTVIEQAINAAVTRGVYNRAEVVLIDQCLKQVSQRMSGLLELIAQKDEIFEQLEEDLAKKTKIIADLEHHAASLVTADTKESYQTIGEKMEKTINSKT